MQMRTICSYKERQCGIWKRDTKSAFFTLRRARRPTGSRADCEQNTGKDAWTDPYLLLSDGYFADTFVVCRGRNRDRNKISQYYPRWVYGKKVLPIIYDLKTRNVLSDLKWHTYLELENLETCDVPAMLKGVDRMPEAQLNELISKSEEQFLDWTGCLETGKEEKRGGCQFL